jgi:structural maintenance of chromosomes protein 5
LLCIRSTHREKVQDLVANCSKLERESKLAKNQFHLKKQVYKDLQEKAIVEAPLQDEEGNETALKEKLQVDLAQYETIDYAEAALEEVEHKIRSTFADRNVANFYERKEKELDVAQDQLHALTKGKDKKMEDLRTKAEPWQVKLHILIQKIDSRFSRYMSELGCTGEVCLRQGKAGADKDEDPRFDDYGVEIKVSFREGVKPSVLSARVQSGGERSVSTIMYLMAMQVGAFGKR